MPQRDFGSCSTKSSIATAVERATAILPHQPILENFVHHNPLEEIQHLEFREAIQYAKDLESYKPPAERAYKLTGSDPRKRAKGAIVDLAAVFLDRGAAKWAPRFRQDGFLFFFANLEGMGLAPWRRPARKAANKILASVKGKDLADGSVLKALSEQIIQENLEHFGIPPDEWESCVLAMLLNVRGWAGMFHRMETHPNEAPDNVRVSLIEFCAVQSIISRSAVQAVAKDAGWDSDTTLLSTWLSRGPTVRTVPTEYHTVHQDSRIAAADQGLEGSMALEDSYEQKLIAAISAIDSLATDPVPPQLQLLACIDDREGSLRRHFEQADPTMPVETFGVAGFFGLPIRYKPIDSHVPIDLSPDGNPKFDVFECDHKNHPGEVGKYKLADRAIGQASKVWEALSFSPAGSLLLSLLAPFSFVRLVLMGYAPLWTDAIQGALFRRILPVTQTNFEPPLSAAAAAALLAPTFKSSGLSSYFSPLVVVLGHGATSVNNPYGSAYNCGACGGHRGGPNSRVFARLANDPDVRSRLREEHCVDIPDETILVAGEHNTTSDIVRFYDEEDIPFSHLHRFSDAKRLLSKALGENALERCHRFFLADARTTESALRHVHQRSTDLAEVRPELNHATNAAVVIGRRSLTRGSFFDRRVFLPSYDPFIDDDEGTQLEGVLAPALRVGSGINLEYLFSTIASDRHGAGTKAPLNVVGNIGMQQGTYGDLRAGLPSQMVEMHVPLRALYVVDSPVRRLEAVFKRRSDLEVLVRNNWVRMATRDPDTGKIYRYCDGYFVQIPMQDDELSRQRLTVESEWGAFKDHHDHGMKIKHQEDLVYGLVSTGMLASFIGPLIALDGAAMMNANGVVIAACATSLSLPVLGFSQRYLHGEHLFTRFSLLSNGLLLGFNMVAMAPSLEQAVVGWGLFGFSSTFLIGLYNDRPNVRNNALFAFAAYRISDYALLTAVAFGGSPANAAHANPELVAGGLLLAAMFKSSQMPLTALFARSMEGPTPSSALGYAGLSAHVGVVLLAATADLWMPFDWARTSLGVIGACTAVHGGMVSQIHADRKGALAYATSSTLGLLYVVMAAGYANEALALAMGHASFRMVQVLRSSSTIDDSKQLASALDGHPWPKVVPDWLYRTCWVLHRFDTDLHAMNVLHQISTPLGLMKAKDQNLSEPQQWLALGAGLTVAGIPFTPFSVAMDHLMVELLRTDPALAGVLMLSYFGISVITMRFLLLNVLNKRRPPSI